MNYLRKVKTVTKNVHNYVQKIMDTKIPHIFIVRAWNDDLLKKFRLIAVAPMPL